MLTTSQKPMERYRILANKLADYVKDQPAGQKMPSIRNIMKQFSVSQATVDKSISLLEAEGLIERIAGKGIFVADRKKKQLHVDVCFFFSRDVIDNPLYSSLTSRMFATANNYDMHLSVFVYNNMGCINRFRERIARTRPDGIILMCLTKITFETILREMRIPVISVFPNAMDEQSTTVIIDNYKGIELAAEHLISLGHTKIAMLHGQGYRNTYILDQEERIDAFYSVMHKHELIVRPEYLTYGGFEADEGYKAALELLSCKLPPTAIICNDYNAEGVYRAVKEKGLLVGKDISIIGFDDIPSVSKLNPPLTTVKIGWDRISDYVIERINDVIHTPDAFKGKCFRTNVDLVIRQSTGENI